MPATFFLDRSLGKKVVAQALKAAGAHVEIHDDHFASDARDEEWLTDVGLRGWVVLTKDRKFHTRILEITAIARSQVRVFKLTAAGLQGPEMASIFVKSISKINRFVTGNSAPFIATIDRNAKVKLAFSAARLKRYRA
jgi:predicted nuclease of predicted toxin-antitoxin system